METVSPIDLAKAMLKLRLKQNALTNEDIDFVFEDVEKAFSGAKEDAEFLKVIRTEVKEGSIEVDMAAAKEVSRYFTASMDKILGDAPNYVELSFHVDGKPYRLVTTIQRVPGRSPAEFRKDATEVAKKLLEAAEWGLATAKNLAPPREEADDGEEHDEYTDSLNYYEQVISDSSHMLKALQ